MAGTPGTGGRRYLLQCDVPLSTIVWESLLCFLLSVMTGGLALPFYLFRIGRLLIEGTELIDADELILRKAGIDQH